VRKALLLILFSIAIVCAHGQTHHQNLYWLRYQALFNFSPKVYWHNDIDNRRFFGPDVQNQLIIHSRVHYKKDRWDFGAGLTYSVAYAAFPEAGVTSVIKELRPVAEVNYEIPIRGWFVAQRFRLDNRFFQEAEDVSIFRESRYVTRLRYRIQGRIPLKKNQDNITTVTLKSAIEMMANMQENFYDQGRFYASSEFYLTKKFSAELGYIYVHQQRFGRDEFFSRNVLRFSLYHRVLP
jgi:hypothetical protein